MVPFSNCLHFKCNDFLFFQTTALYYYLNNTYGVHSCICCFFFFFWFLWNSPKSEYMPACFLYMISNTICCMLVAQSTCNVCVSFCYNTYLYDFVLRVLAVAVKQQHLLNDTNVWYKMFAFCFSSKLFKYCLLRTSWFKKNDC